MPNINNKQIKFFIAAFIANIAHSMLVYSIVVYSWQLTKQSTSSGIAFFTLYAPVLFLTMHAGKLADFYSRFLLVTISQAISGLFCIGLTLLFTTVNPSFWILLLLVLAYGTAITYSGPARFAAAADISSRGKQEGATIKLHILNFIAMGVGPITAGSLIKYASANWLFGLIACLFGVSSIFTAQLCFSEKRIQPKNTSGNKVSFRQIFQSMPQLMPILSIVALVTVCMSGPIQALVPIFSKQVLALDEILSGAMMTPFAIGLVIGGAASHKLLIQKARGQIIITSILIGLISILLLGLSQNPVIAALCLTILGISGGCFSGLASASLQYLSDDSFRGQVMGFYSLLMIGATAIGGFFASFISQKIGIGNSFICLAVLGCFWLLITSVASKFYLFNVGITSSENLKSMTPDSQSL